MSNRQIIKIDDTTFRDFFGRFTIIKDSSIKSLRIIPTNPSESLTLEELTRIQNYIVDNSLSTVETGGNNTLPANVITTDTLGTYPEFLTEFEKNLL